MKEIGDLSIIAAKGKETMGTMDKFGFKTNIVKRKLTLKSVMETIYKIADIKGKDSVEEKEKMILKLFFDASPIEIKYLVRSLEKSLKIGASLKTIISSLSRAIVKYYFKKKVHYETKFVKEIILKAIFQMCDYDLVMENIIEVVVNNLEFKKLLEKCTLSLGIPMKPMLAKATTGVNMVSSRFSDTPFTCEYKYDGFRGQIHYIKEKIFDDRKKKLGLFKTANIQIFSRNLENMTESYPDIVSYFTNYLATTDITNCILDCEIVPFNTETNTILTFNFLQKRGRVGVTNENISTRVCCFLFDIIMLNSEVLMEKTLEERRVILEKNFSENVNMKITKYMNSQDPEEIVAFMDESIKAGCEGLIVKALNIKSEYQPGERNFNWLKLKKDYLTDCTIGDSLDLIPIGANYGKGKRTGTYGSFLLACYNEDLETFETVSMTGAGLKDEDLKNFFSVLSEVVISKPLSSYKVSNPEEVAVWFEPKLVWEIKTADLSLSPKYSAAENLLGDGKGISLRFPRFIRERSDKTPLEATTSEQILKMYNEQAMNEKNIQKYTLKEEDSDEDI